MYEGGGQVFIEKQLPLYAKQRIEKTGSKRGYGYWSWKSSVIKLMFSEMQDGDILLYCDAGCHLNPFARTKFFEYVKKTESFDILCAVLPDEYKEYTWTKMDTITLFKDKIQEQLLETGQLLATSIFVKKTDIQKILSKNGID